jgi:catechol 2,3-dioxygenase-like lactoylglutathione lyase family enzyme
MHILSLDLLTNRLEETKQFYINQLGFPLKVQSTDAFTFKVGYTELTFQQAQTGDEPKYHFAMNIPAKQWSEAKDWLEEKGCTLLPTPSVEEANIQSVEHDVVFFDAIQAYSLYFHDPAGNLVEFIARENLESNSSSSFDIGSILNISEILFAFDQDLPEAMEKLCDHFHVEPYTGDQKTFQILGDDEGTFILNDIRRGYYPTQQRAEIHPLQMTVLGAKRDALYLKPYPYVVHSTPKELDSYS